MLAIQRIKKLKPGLLFVKQYGKMKFVSLRTRWSDGFWSFGFRFVFFWGACGSKMTKEIIEGCWGSLDKKEGSVRQNGEQSFREVWKS